jgi:hypothetical protein
MAFEARAGEKSVAPMESTGTRQQRCCNRSDEETRSRFGALSFQQHSSSRSRYAGQWSWSLSPDGPDESRCFQSQLTVEVFAQLVDLLPRRGGDACRGSP